jgi:hypothetical protein
MNYLRDSAKIAVARMTYKLARAGMCPGTYRASSTPYRGSQKVLARSVMGAVGRPLPKDNGKNFAMCKNHARALNKTHEPVPG